MKNDIESVYFLYLTDIVKTDRPFYRTNLLHILFKTPFRYSMPMDANRYEDGIEMRYQFGYDNHISNAEIAYELDIRDCSLLEMLVALAIKMSDIDDQPPSKWFWDMIKNLGLFAISDRDSVKIKHILDRFMDREYSRVGVGGLFTIPDTTANLRSVELWYQAMWYLTYLENRKGGQPM